MTSLFSTEERAEILALVAAGPQSDPEHPENLANFGQVYELIYDNITQFIDEFGTEGPEDGVGPIQPVNATSRD